MSRLSNEPRPGAADRFAVGPARRDQIDEALRLILGDGRPASNEQVLDFLAAAMQRGLRVTETWVACEQDHVAWAALPVTSPGRTALLLQPSWGRGAWREAASALLPALLDHLARRGVAMVQALFEPREHDVIDVHLQCAFERLAELIYLERPVRHAPSAAAPTGMRWVSYGPASADLFEQTIQRTYERSLDCPTLNGRREIRDVIAGHQAVGVFDGAWWQMLVDGQTPLGVSLVSRHAETPTAELIYLGLTLPGRGRRLGDLLMQRALSIAWSGGATRLTLAVDAGNTPALRLYGRHGLRTLTRRVTLVRMLPGWSA